MKQKTGEGTADFTACSGLFFGVTHHRRTEQADLFRKYLFF